MHAGYSTYFAVHFGILPRQLYPVEVVAENITINLLHRSSFHRYICLSARNRVMLILSNDTETFCKRFSLSVFLFLLQSRHENVKCINSLSLQLINSP